jgi:hypothetical protein
VPEGPGIAIAIDDKTWQAVRLAVCETIGGGIDLKRLAIRNCRIETSTPRVQIGHVCAARQQTQRNLGSIAV